MATKLITLVPNLSTEEIQAMIDTKIDETDLVANLDFQNHLTAANPHGITPAMINAAAATHTHANSQTLNFIYGTDWSQAPIAGFPVNIQKTSEAIIHITGYARRTNNSSNRTILQLPAEWYKTDKNFFFINWYYDGANWKLCSLTITPSGTLVVNFVQPLASPTSNVPIVNLQLCFPL